MLQKQLYEKVLALAGHPRSNAPSFTPAGSMPAKKFPLPDFDSCSVALFASLVFMGPLPSRAQQQPPARPALSAPGALPLPRALPSRRPSPAPLAPPQPDWRSAEPDGSISSPGFDEALK